MVWKNPEETNILKMLQCCVLKTPKKGKIQLRQPGNSLCSLPYLQLVTLIIVQDIFMNRFFDAKEHVNKSESNRKHKTDLPPPPSIREVTIMLIKSF